MCPSFGSSNLMAVNSDVQNLMRKPLQTPHINLFYSDMKAADMTWHYLLKHRAHNDWGSEHCNTVDTASSDFYKYIQTNLNTPFGLTLQHCFKMIKNKKIIIALFSVLFSITRKQKYFATSVCL